MTRIRYILFDAVGTLIRPAPPAAEVYAAHGGRFGSQRTAADIRLRLAALLAAPRSEAGPLEHPTSEARERQRWREIVSQIFDDVPAAGEELFQSLWDHFATPRHWSLYDDVAPSWRRLAGETVALGIASNFDGRLHAVCDAWPPLDACRQRWISSEIGFAKPDPRFYAAIAARLEVAPAALLLVGDDPLRDVAAPRAAGWGAILIDRRAKRSSPEVLRDLRELPSLLDARR